MAMRGVMAGVLFAASSMVATVAVIPVATGPSAAAAAGTTSAYVAVGPLRLADTRQPECGCTRVDGSTIRVVIAGRAGVPDAIDAATVTVTAVGGPLAGFVTAYPSGSVRPTTSVTNVGPATVAANSTIVRVGTDGSIDFFMSTEMQIVVDVTGVFVAATSSTAGRFVAVAPRRLLDTREQMADGLVANAIIDVPLPDGVSADATAVAVNVTALGGRVAGFVTGGSAGLALPSTSFVNPDGSGRPRAATVILPVSAQGISLRTSVGGHLVVDIVGWFTGPSAPMSTDGLFIAMDPTRLVDTRPDASRLWPTGEREVATAIDGAAALVTNVTLDRTDGAGFVTAYAAGTPRPATSSLNAPGRDATVANLAITAVSDRGLGYYSMAGTDLVVDVTGAFTGTPVVATQAPGPNVVPSHRVLMIGDSTLGALSIVNRTREALTGFSWELDAANCRRIVDQGCVSDYTKIAPTTVIEAIASARGSFDIVVIKAGYNDPLNPFVPSVDAVVRAARATGIRLVVWFTFSDSTSTLIRLLEQHNATLKGLVGSGAYPELVVADWHDYSINNPSWFVADRHHLTVAGAWATADYIGRYIANLDRRPCPRPWTPGEALEPVCPNPDAVAAPTGSPPNLRALYGF
ncbi:MAG: hypothetical protein ABIR32_11985 [Ilumatobacteraceae bacterium]